MGSEFHASGTVSVMISACWYVVLTVTGIRWAYCSSWRCIGRCTGGCKSPSGRFERARYSDKTLSVRRLRTILEASGADRRKCWVCRSVEWCLGSWFDEAVS